MNSTGLVGTDLKAYTADPFFALYSRLEDKYGRVFRYVQAGASNLVVGNVIQSAAPIAHHVDMTPTATAAGAYVVNVTPGATAGAANLYAGGQLVISTTPGLGETYNINKHAAITASTAFDVYLDRDDTIITALTTSSRVDLKHNPGKNVIQAPVTTLTGHVVGVAIAPITAAYYGWVQTWGPCGTLIAGTPAVGARVVSPGSAAGAVVVDPANTADAIIGEMMETGVDGKCKLVFLKIAP